MDSQPWSLSHTHLSSCRPALGAWRHYTFIDKLLPESFQTTAKISRVGYAHPDFFQGGRLPTLLPPCRRLVRLIIVRPKWIWIFASHAIRTTPCSKKVSHLMFDNNFGKGGLTFCCICSGYLCDVYIENFLTNHMVKEFRKLVHICQSYQTSSGSLF